ncbi:hypothetical protein JCM17844_26750 [Iodidimonas gelatinilytica]|uniref:PEGA domain-containing protein n=1 Tax=Iodidimonas gelatinilytica TaxID=1236966 RepID=A0A5A7MY61_9PROT|nr:hypothetical protein [Iodidimonas gelatinilytica]GEQ99038.1 hypothetical protein JCM17844_26750 [Iodidimonas gelatinilytica]GER00778.1 hypothetical protein JCM17845_14010 [Iodidimonas gelatinilytica]
MTKFFVALAASLLLAACGSMPKHANVRSDEPAIVQVIGAPEGSSVLWDGAILGQTSGKTTRFEVGAGSHKLVVRTGTQILFDRDIFIQDGTTRNIQIGQ